MPTHRYEVLYKESDSQNYSAHQPESVYIERTEPIGPNDIINVRGEAVMIDAVMQGRAEHFICVTPIGPAQ